MQRRTGSAMLFAVAAALVAWAAWPGSPSNFATSVDRVDVITMVVVLAGLALLARRFFGPAGDSRAARFLRVGAYVAILVLIAAKATVEQLTFAPPRVGVVLRPYRLISGGGFGPGWPPEIIFLAVMALYAIAILWMTSRRSRVAPATLAIGTGTGIVLGVVMYVVAPLGLTVATNPWLPGSDITPFVALAWILSFGAPVGAAVVVERRYAAPGRPPRPADARAREIVAAVCSPILSARCCHRSGHWHDRSDVQGGMAANLAYPRSAPALRCRRAAAYLAGRPGSCHVQS